MRVWAIGQPIAAAALTPRRPTWKQVNGHGGRGEGQRPATVLLSGAPTQRFFTRCMSAAAR